MNALSTFDPLLFLGLTNVKPEAKKVLSEKLLDRISQYITVRTIELLPQDDLKDIHDPDKLFSVAKEKIPDFDKKAKAFLEDFKQEFTNNFKQL
jgi:hypothetical protein